MEIREFKKTEAKADKPGAARKAVGRVPGRMDFLLLIAVIAISLFGLIMVLSASYYYAESRFDDGLSYFRSQSLFLAMGVVIMLVVSRFDYRKLLKFKLYALPLAFSILALILVLIDGVGVERNGARRWIEIGSFVTFQPSEIAKLSLILFMSAFMGTHAERLNSFFKGVVPMLLCIGLVCGLILLQPNMSMMVIVCVTGIFMMFIGGVKMKHITWMFVVMIAAFALFAITAEYRFERLLSFLDPWSDPSGNGYQQVQSLYALGAGGLFGRGLNFSQQKLLFLPYSESDFIFSIIGEELGYIGCIALMAAYVFIIYRGLMIAIRCKDKFGSLLAAGITVTIGSQALVNMGVAMCALPVTGQTLPFISAGGTSLIICLAAMGILLNISRNTV